MSDAFLSAVARCDLRIDLVPLRRLLEQVAPCGRSWGVEIGGTQAERLPDFGCAVARHVDVEHWPELLSHAPSFRLLQRLVGGIEAEGPWFFEFDANACGNAYTGEVHSFARLPPALRETKAFAERIIKMSPPFHRLGRAVAALASRLRNGSSFSDVGVIVRSREPELRIGIPVPVLRLGAVISGIGDPLLQRVAMEIAERCTDRVLAALQVGVQFSDGRLSLRGIELSQPEGTSTSWSSVVSFLRSRCLIDPTVAEAVMGWSGHERCQQTGHEWPPVLTRGISHLKLSASGNRPVKFYLVATETFSLFV